MNATGIVLVAVPAGVAVAAISAFLVLRKRNNHRKE